MTKRNKKKKAKKEAEEPLPKILSEGVEEIVTAGATRRQLDELGVANRHMKRKIFDLYTIFEISRNFSAVLDYKTLLDSFIFTCLGQVGVLRGAIFLKERIDARVFKLAEAKGSGSMPGPELVFEDDSRLARYLTRLNRPVFLYDLSSNMTTPEEARILGFFKGGMIAPLIYKTRLAGLFLLGEKMSAQVFNQDEIEFVSALGNQISVAIENARLYEAEKSANEQLWSAQQKLVQAERMAALGEMSAKIAHEVNNPLGIIKNYLLLLKRAGGKAEVVEEYVDIVNQEIDRIAVIVEDLRQFQRPNRVEFSAINLYDTIDSTLTLVSRQLGVAGIELVREYGDDELWIKGNTDHLRQVCLNIILNAGEAMLEGGVLTVELHQIDNHAVVTFLDTGPGIPDEVIPRIFEPFFTTRGSEGSGLGLSVCDGIMKSHKGSINYRNTDVGGCFEIHLPLIEKQ
ncbi:MAG: hypothetical protein J7J98_05885 [candidate division Zixibacteria bacterium]|nr:hypothetical protein [candidate division Zixibacteria bacterium]